MANNRGKQCEAKYKEDWKRTVSVCIDRLYDQMSGYVSISNISDFIGFKKPNIFYLECKSHEGNTFPISCLSQYEKLTCKVGLDGVRAGVILWMIDHDVVLYIPISTFTKLIEDGKKSFNIKMLADQTYPHVVIPSEKRRVFLDSDYSCLADLEEGW